MIGRAILAGRRPLVITLNQRVAFRYSQQPPNAKAGSSNGKDGQMIGKSQDFTNFLSLIDKMKVSCFYSREYWTNLRGS